MEKLTILPLAITDVDENHICVASLNNNGTWIRPEVLFKSDIEDENSSYFDYQYKTELFLKSSFSKDARIEDRELVRDKPINKAEKLSIEARYEIITKNLDNSVENIFKANRTAGIVRIKLLDINYGRNFGGGKKIRIKFTDDTGTEFNFILAERRFKKWFFSNLDEKDKLTVTLKDKILNIFVSKEIFFTITLTKKSSGFPGPYNGCHPLIAGVHTFSDYL
ncbi:MAG: hypothetical protein AB6733_09275 [Clostridiaceae bacterium]